MANVGEVCVLSLSPPLHMRILSLPQVIRGGLEKYVEEVRSGQFPAPEHSTHMADEVILQMKEEILGHASPVRLPSLSQFSPCRPSLLLTASLTASFSLCLFFFYLPLETDSFLFTPFYIQKPSLPSPPHNETHTHFLATHLREEDCRGLSLSRFLSSAPIVVIGGGSMGTLFASRLSSRYPVLLISNYGKHIRAIREGGGVHVTSLPGFGKEMGEGGRGGGVWLWADMCV